jgi:AraC-like DNA-binding protein
MITRKLHRSACLTNYVELAKELGISPIEQLRRVDINPTCLNNPDTMIPFGSFVRLMENSARAAGVENFGLRMAEGRRPSNLGPLAFILKSQRTLRDALEALRRYCHLQAEAVSVFFEEVDGTLIIREELLPDHPEPMRQATELSLGVICLTLRVLLGKAWQPSSVCFRHSPPGDLTVHRRIFDTRLYFDRAFDGIICRAANLDDTLPDYDPETARYLLKLLTAVNTQPAQSITDRVRELVCALLPTGRCSIEVVAKHLGLDRRTLHRHLQKEDASFSELSDSVRGDLAIKYLTESHRSLKEVAELLGFSEPSAFSRWFTHRFGCTATTWRQERKKEDPGHAVT